jgi:hypothetical protein
VDINMYGRFISFQHDIGHHQISTPNSEFLPQFQK